jgi:hypothetical protein
LASFCPTGRQNRSFGAEIGKNFGEKKTVLKYYFFSTQNNWPKAAGTLNAKLFGNGGRFLTIRKVAANSGHTKMYSSRGSWAGGQAGRRG